MNEETKTESEYTPEQIAEALEKSIAHWERFATGTALPGEAPDSENCALCRLFIKRRPSASYCTGCPVALETNQYGCDGTPWFAANCEFNAGGPKSPRFQAAAKLMLNFLEGLRVVKQEATDAERILKINQR